jgi:hypothetical protein
MCVKVVGGWETDQRESHVNVLSFASNQFKQFMDYSDVLNMPNYLFKDVYFG